MCRSDQVDALLVGTIFVSESEQAQEVCDFGNIRFVARDIQENRQQSQGQAQQVHLIELFDVLLPKRLQCLYELWSRVEMFNSIHF